MTNAHQYGIAVRLVRQDGEETYEAKVAELPDVAAYGETFSEAYECAIEAIRGLQSIFESKGKAFPAPQIDEGDFSGRVTLRMSKSLHRCIHEQAARDGVSLNQWIVEAVAARGGGESRNGQTSPADVLAPTFLAHGTSVSITELYDLHSALKRHDLVTWAGPVVVETVRQSPDEATAFAATAVATSALQ